jgi:hypothetical protein
VTFEADLKTHLQADATISNLVGDRIHPMLLPQVGALPAITYQHIGGVPMNDLSGGDGDLMNYRVQINCWATGHTAARALAEAVRNRLQTAAASFKAVLTLEQDVYEEAPRRFGVYMDFSFWYRIT